MENKDLEKLSNFIIVWALGGMLIYFIALYPIFTKNGILNPVQTQDEINVLLYGFAIWFVYLIVGIRYSISILKFIGNLFNKNENN